MSRIIRTLSGSLLAAAMLTSSTAAFTAPLTADAGQLLGQTDFEDGTGIPWHTCESTPAVQDFEITDDGKYVVRIVNPNGSQGRWDLQFRHDGLQLINGHKYEVKAEITASDPGYVFSRIGDYSGNEDYWNDIGDGEWKPHYFEAGETLKIDTTFTATNTWDGPSQWAFYYADNNGMFLADDTGMPAGATLTFDNLSLIDLSGCECDYERPNEFGAIRPQSNVRLNQLGYYEENVKQASYVTDESAPLTFHIYDASGTEVYQDTASKVIADDYDSGTPSDTTATLDKGIGKMYKDTGKYVQILDFSDFTTGGEGYYIVVDDTVGVSGTRSGKLEGAFDTTIEDGKVMWTNWKTGSSYQMNRSHPFDISNSVYDGLLRDSLNYFYQNRSGCTIDPEYITSGDKESLGHNNYGHKPDTAYVQPKWVKYYPTEFDGDKSYSITATGGWYDADSFCKSVVNGGSAVWTLQNMYEMSLGSGTESMWTDGKTMSVPEGGDDIPDVLNEARYELDWMFDMIVKPEDPFFGEDAGLVYHKIQDSVYTGLALHPWIYEGFDTEKIARIVKPPTYAATFNMIACAAQASRLWLPFDREYSKKCLEYAETSLAAAEKRISKWMVSEGFPLEQDDSLSTNVRGDDPYFAPLDQAIGGAAYGDTYVEDDYYWALCELFATTGKEEYYTKLMQYDNRNDSTGMDKALSLTNNLTGGENWGSFSSFNWGCTAGYGTLSLYLNSERNVPAEDHEKIVEAIVRAADYYIEEERKQGMGIPYHGSSFQDEISIGPGYTVTGYENRSNSFVVNNAMVMAYAHDATGNRDYRYGASTAMDYIFGRNGNDFSYVSGYGDVALQNPEHVLWAHGVDPSFPKAPAGCLSGGPYSGLADKYVRGLGMKRGTLASQKCYADSSEAWSVNSLSLDMNASLAWMTFYLQNNRWGDYGRCELCEKHFREMATKKATEPYSTPGTVTLWGDANEDGKVTISDSVAVLQYLCNQNKYKLSANGIANADLVDAGKGITGDDAIAIQKIDASLIQQSDCPIASGKLKDYK